MRFAPTLVAGCGGLLGAPLALSSPTPQEPRPVPRATDLPAATLAVTATETLDGIAAWLRTCAIETERGLTWPTDPLEPAGVSTNLYDGAPGVVLFFLQRHRAAPDVDADARDLADAVRGADELLARVDAPGMGAGLYVGLAGIGFVFDELHATSGHERFREGAERCVRRLEQTARTTEAGVTWSGVTDIISGSAGTGLWLLQHAERTGDARALRLAERAGRELLASAERTEHGLRWAMQPGYARSLPNFSHGGAGVAYFLAELHASLEREDVDHGDEFLDAAVAGAAELRAIRAESGLIAHHLPGGEDLFYLGWCHGPPGTARLFWRLFELTGDASYAADVELLAAALRAARIPAERTPGFWNNVGVCCGSAGVAAFLDDYGRAKATDRDAALVEALTRDLVARATIDGEGARWAQAEHRTRPDLLVAQTGLMQGAAGIGLWLLRQQEPAAGAARLPWPDSPWVRAAAVARPAQDR